MKYKLNINIKKLDTSLNEKVLSLISKQWNDSYKNIMKDKSRKKLVIHDGPPYANGSIHLGHAINKIAKDVIIRKKISIGLRVHYLPGWDCHGLPIEIVVGRNKKKRDYSNYVKEQINNQIEGLRRLGCIINWKINYKTMDKKLIGKEIEAFFILLNNRKLLIGKKEIKFCKECNSTLSEFEIDKKLGIKTITLSIYRNLKLKAIVLVTRNVNIKGRIEVKFKKRKVIILNSNKIKMGALLGYCKAKVLRIAIRVPISLCWRHKSILKSVKKTQIYINTRVDKDISDINFFPENTREKFIYNTFRRPQWCISRQRTWGVRIPIFFYKNIVLRNKKLEDLLIKNIEFLEKIKLSNKYINFKKCRDVFDVWFDSGLTHYTVLNKKKGGIFPADIYMEGKDQHRGWFNSSYITSMLINNRPPFRNLITHGFAVDSLGEKMSKSLGNVVSPKEIADKYGIETLRFLISTSNYYKDILFSEERIRNKMFLIRKIKNVIEFMYRNTLEIKNNTNTIISKVLIDRYILIKMEELKHEVYKMDSEYKSYKSYELIERFIIKTISSLYISNIKDRLYVLCKEDNSRRECQLTISLILENILVLISPFLPYYSEIVWQKLFDCNILKARLRSIKVNISKKEIRSIEKLIYFKKEFNKLKVIDKEKKILLIKTRDIKTIKHMEEEIKFFMHNYKNIVLKGNKDGIELLSKNNVKKCSRCLGFSSNIRNEICGRCTFIIKGYNQKRLFF
ncbi:class I tRNA ligase family protein [Candidatus Vidania fulgoroideae]|uniref:Class I tRNA ligase family protein n=1 Tax=Candidatus Vidania fulgoroideorum TaxID=881286 RepID=A0A974X7I4_9PROT|nr:class I tRNA ligase family protein [Candidatus Vidania fulgoroideae]